MEDAALPMSDLRRSEGSRADAFLLWTSPRDAAIGTVEIRRNPGANRRGRWLGAVVLACSIAIHLGLLRGLSMPLARETVGATSGKMASNNFQVRFFEIRLVAHPRKPELAWTVPATTPRHPAIVMTQVAPAMNVAKAPSISATPDAIAIPAVVAVGDVSLRPDDWNAEPPDKHAARLNDYIQDLPHGDANVMKHSTGGVTYNATRFDSSWAPDRQNAITQAIDRATFHTLIKLHAGVQLDCAAGPGSPEPLRTSVAALAIASTRCHISPPPAPVAVKSMIDIQTLASGQPLMGRTEPSTSVATLGTVAANATACAHTRTAAEKLPSGCHTPAPIPATADESGLFPGTRFPNKPPEPLIH